MSFWGHWGQKIIFTKNDKVLFRKSIIPRGSKRLFLWKDGVSWSTIVRYYIASVIFGMGQWGGV